MLKKACQYWRIICQGVAMAAWGTMWLTSSWGSFSIGVAAAILGMVLFTLEVE